MAKKENKSGGVGGLIIVLIFAVLSFCVLVMPFFLIWQHSIYRLRAAKIKRQILETEDDFLLSDSEKEEIDDTRKKLDEAENALEEFETEDAKEARRNADGSFSRRSYRGQEIATQFDYLSSNKNKLQSQYRELKQKAPDRWDEFKEIIWEFDSHRRKACSAGWAIIVYISILIVYYILSERTSFPEFQNLYSEVTKAPGMIVFAIGAPNMWMLLIPTAIAGIVYKARLSKEIELPDTNCACLKKTMGETGFG